MTTTPGGSPSESLTSAIPIHSMDALDIDRLRADYDHVGCVIVRNAVEPELLTDLRLQLIGFFRTVLRHHGGSLPTQADDLDSVHEAAIHALGPEKSKFLLTLGKDFSAFWGLVGSRRIQGLIQALFQSNEIQTIADSNVLRIDRPNHDVTILDWHQDYPYNMLTAAAATVWAPLTPVDRAMGRLRVVVPRNTLLPIVYDHARKKNFHDSGYVQIDNLETLRPEFEKHQVEVPEVGVGDLVLLHATVVHASGKNRGQGSRWVFTARYAPFDDAAAAERIWFAVRAKYPLLFKTIHPQLFSERNQDLP